MEKVRGGALYYNLYGKKYGLVNVQNITDGYPKLTMTVPREGNQVTEGQRESHHSLDTYFEHVKT